MKRRLLGRPPGTPIPDAARRGRPDWQQSDPRWIRQAVAHAGRLPAGGWYVIDAVRAIGSGPMPLPGRGPRTGRLARPLRPAGGAQRLPAPGRVAGRRTPARRLPGVPLARPGAGAGRSPRLAAAAEPRRRRAAVGPPCRRRSGHPTTLPVHPPAHRHRRRDSQGSALRAAGHHRQPVRSVARRALPSAFVRRPDGARAERRRHYCTRGVSRHPAHGRGGRCPVSLPRSAHHRHDHRRRRGRRLGGGDARHPGTARHLCDRGGDRGYLAAARLPVGDARRRPAPAPDAGVRAPALGRRCRLRRTALRVAHRRA